MFERVQARRVSALALAGSLLATGVVPIVAATSADAVTPPEAWRTGSNLSGTIHVRESGYMADSMKTSDKSFRVNLPGPMYNMNGGQSSFAQTQVLSHLERGAYPVEEQSSWCFDNTFAGFVTDPISRVQVDADKAYRVNAANVAFMNVRFTQETPTVRINDKFCDGAELSRTLPLIDDNDFNDNSTASVFGQDADPVGGPSASLSPGQIAFVRQGSVWRSQGSTTRSFRTDGGDFSFSEDRTVTVTWDLTTSSPTRFCQLPTRKSLKNKSLKTAKKQLKRAGFRAGKVGKVRASGVRKGRVSDVAARNYGHQNVRTAMCGSKVGIWVKR